MKEKDLELLWQEIYVEFENNDTLEPGQYLKQKGLEYTDVFSLNSQVKNIISQTFTDTTLNEEVFHSKYKILKQIDSGGQSDIYLAERSDGVYQQTVVIKFISGKFDQKDLKQQFLQEMQLLADLHHPGVVTIIDGNITDTGQPWLVLEFIDGPHIDQYVEQQKSDVNSIVNMVLDLCDTLQFVHQRQVLHKDLKPSNVLVKNINGVPYPVLIDFGIAMQKGEQSALHYGTQGYSAPEQLSGDTVDQKTDLYALGVMFGQLLLICQGTSVQINQIDDLVTVLKKSEVPKDLLKVLFKLVNQDPQKRYHSAAALRSDLSQWQQGFPLSFDNNRPSTVLTKLMKRNPWSTAGLIFIILFSVLFVVKYTKDTQHLQQLTIAEKNATDELMNFMLDDLYQNLKRIGRIDVLQSVAEKSVKHLAKQDPLTLDDTGHIQAAKAYMNTGRVFDFLEQSDMAKQMYLLAESHLGQVEKDDKYIKRLVLLAQLRVYQSQVFSSEGQEQSTETVLMEAIDVMQKVLDLDPKHDPVVLWEASLELSYHLMEYAKSELADQQIKKTISISEQQLKHHPNDAEWLYANSHSFQLKAWFELDFGDLNQGLLDTLKSIEYAKASIDQDKEDIKKHNNLRILFNQLAYFQLENGQQKAAKEAALKAIDLGEKIKLKAPFNQEFERERAYSYTTAGEIYQVDGDLETALNHFQISLSVSKSNFDKDPSNFSAANDLAVDYLLTSDLQKQLGHEQQAQSLVIEAEKLMEPVYHSESNNKYYAYTLLVTKLRLKKITEAKPLFELTKTNGMIDGEVEQLLEELALSDWLQ